MNDAEWRTLYATDPSYWTDMSTDPFEAGRCAAQLDMTIAECPFGPNEAEGLPWRQGWIEGEADKRAAAGTFDHTTDEYVAAQRMVGVDPECTCEVCEQARAKLRGTVVSYGFTVDPAVLQAAVDRFAAAVKPVMQAAADALQHIATTLQSIDVSALQRMFDELANGTPTSGPPTARERERDLLAHRRRSHRRTNRWGPPPGRR